MALSTTKHKASPAAEVVAVRNNAEQQFAERNCAEFSQIDLTQPNLPKLCRC